MLLGKMGNSVIMGAAPIFSWAGLVCNARSADILLFTGKLSSAQMLASAQLKIRPALRSKPWVP